MALGLLGGALAGGAEAAQDNARTRIKQMHDDAILRMRQEFQSSERVAGQEYNTQERVAGQQFTSGENEANRGHDLTLAQMREQGANSRSAMQIAASREKQPQWQMVPDGNGGYIQYDPVGNQHRPANLPEGASFDVSNGALTDVQKARLKEAQDTRESIYERHLGDTSSLPSGHPDLERLGKAEAEIETLLRSGGGGLLGGVMRDLGIDDPGTASASEPVNNEHPPSGSAAPPPRPGVSSVSDIESRMRTQQDERQAARNAEQQNSQIEQTITRIRGLASRMGIGPGQSSSDRQQLANQVRQMADQLIQENNLDDRQIERLEGAIQNVVQYGG